MATADRSATTIERVGSVGELNELLDQYEPRTTALLSEVGEAGLHRWKMSCRAWIVRRSDGALVGAVAVVRHAAFNWTAHPLVIDEVAARPLARLVDASPASELFGFRNDVEPLQPLIDRARRPEVSHVLRTDWDHDVVWDEPDPRTRMATVADLEAIARLQWETPILPFPNRASCRRHVARSIARDTVVVEVDGEIVGSLSVTARTGRYDMIGDWIVDRSHRRQGLSGALLSRMLPLVRARGVGLLGLRASTNPWAMPAEALADELWWSVLLAPRRRVRGERRLWWWLSERLVEERPDGGLVDFRDPHDPGDDRIEPEIRWTTSGAPISSPGEPPDGELTRND